jgi:hypothetical protein
LRAVVVGEAARVRECSLVAQNIDEDAVAAFRMQAVDRLVEDLIVIHLATPASAPVPRRLDPPPIYAFKPLNATAIFANDS